MIAMLRQQTTPRLVLSLRTGEFRDIVYVICQGPAITGMNCELCSRLPLYGQVVLLGNSDQHAVPVAEVAESSGARDRHRITRRPAHHVAGKTPMACTRTAGPPKPAVNVFRSLG